LVADHHQLGCFEKIVGRENLNIALSRCGKFLATNEPLAGSYLPKETEAYHQAVPTQSFRVRERKNYKTFEKESRG
jgi:hypothetical protein